MMATSRYNSKTWIIGFLVFLQISGLWANSDEAYCDKETGSCDENATEQAEKEKYREVDPRWQKYLDKIHQAVENYKPCPKPDKKCACHSSVITKDLKLWKDRGGITKEEFDRTLEQDKGTHYQIIDHKLYRQDRCMFPARQGFFLLLVGCNKELERLIERVQRRALRIISLGGRREVPPLPTLKERREVAAVKLLKDMLDEGHPLHDLVPPARKTATGRTLRNGTALTVPAARTNRLKNSFLHKAICLYNESML